MGDALSRATAWMRQAAIAPFGYIALVACMFVGRLFGDRLVDRFGEAAVARAGGTVVAAGMGAALAFPSVPSTIAGFAAAGLGIATLIPAAMHAADQTARAAPGHRPDAGHLAAADRVPGVAPGRRRRRRCRGAAGRACSSVPLAGVVTVVLAGALSGRGRPSRS